LSGEGVLSVGALLVLSGTGEDWLLSGEGDVLSVGALFVLSGEGDV
jgi:hypothetical protein